MALHFLRATDPRTGGLQPENCEAHESYEGVSPGGDPSEALAILSEAGLVGTCAGSVCGTGTLLKENHLAEKFGAQAIIPGDLKSVERSVAKGC